MHQWLSIASSLVLTLLTTVLAAFFGWLLWRYRASGWHFLTSLSCTDVCSCHSHLRLLGTCKGIDGSNPALQQTVERLADAQRVERARGHLPLGAVLLPGIILRNAWTSYHLASADDHEYLLKRATAFLVTPLLLAGVVFYLKPATLTKATLRVVYTLVVAIALYTSIIADYDGEEESIYRSPPRETLILLEHLSRLWFGLVLQDSYFVTVTHVVVIPTAVVNYIVQKDSAAEVLVCTGVELLFAYMVCTSTATLERASKASIHANLQAESARALEGAVEVLLSTTCDAVVHLSGSMRLTQPCPRLSALLLRDPSAPLQEQGSFCDLLMQEDDVAAFKTFIHTPNRAEDALACTMHATLRDSYGMPVLVQLFHATCIGIDSKEVHLVGIQDVGGERYSSVPPDLRGDVAEMLLQRHQAAALEPINEGSVWQSETESASSAFLEAMAATVQDDSGAIKVWVNVLEGSLPMQRWTLGFLGIIGPLAARVDEDLLALVPSAQEQDKLMRTLQQVTNSLLHSCPGISANLDLSLNTSHLGVINVMASVQLDWDLLAEAEGDDEMLPITLHFKSWRCSRHRSSCTTRTPLVSSRSPRSSEGEILKTMQDYRQLHL